MRRFSIPAGQMMAPLTARDIAARHGAVTQDASSITWNTETFAQNQNANAIRYSTLYNFRFDADQPPNPTNATVGYFKTGSPTLCWGSSRWECTVAVANANTDSQPIAYLYGYADPNADTLRRSYDNSDKRKHCAGHHRHW